MRRTSSRFSLGARKGLLPARSPSCRLSTWIAFSSHPSRGRDSGTRVKGKGEPAPWEGKKPPLLLPRLSDYRPRSPPPTHTTAGEEGESLRPRISWLLLSGREKAVEIVEGRVARERRLGSAERLCAARQPQPAPTPRRSRRPGRVQSRGAPPKAPASRSQARLRGWGGERGAVSEERGSFRNAGGRGGEVQPRWSPLGPGRGSSALLSGRRCSFRLDRPGTSLKAARHGLRGRSSKGGCCCFQFASGVGKASPPPIERVNSCAAAGRDVASRQVERARAEKRLCRCNRPQLWETDFWGEHGETAGPLAAQSPLPPPPPADWVVAGLTSLTGEARG